MAAVQEGRRVVRPPAAGPSRGCGWRCARLVVAPPAGQAVPEHFKPTVPEGAERGVVAVVVGDVPVVELSCPPGSLEGTERPLLHRISQVSVARQPARDDVLTLSLI